MTLDEFESSLKKHHDFLNDLARAENAWVRNCTIKNLEALKAADKEVFGDDT